MVKEQYIPDRGDLVWIQFNPQSGHEQSGKRPALVLSPVTYNGKVGLALFCPVTSKAKGYPFEVVIPQDLPIEGVILSDQIKSLDWQSRQAKFICRVPKETLNEVLHKVELLIH
ncbi:endoribonuclease MazF [Paenibacillus glucanolyticus]|uniref:endoribonuclease MazF n=1 Tax=Paenibacillus glucanolyticus TaxID=59843 RepID=UPI00096DFB83|nr:endoribonuclease MazF [Paenibacillus glucanolyticus]OMF68468.1 mRNA-degrading endonuclease [Paenibacillus glucanolyticus]